MNKLKLSIELEGTRAEIYADLLNWVGIINPGPAAEVSNIAEEKIEEPAKEEKKPRKPRAKKEPEELVTDSFEEPVNDDLGLSESDEEPVSEITLKDVKTALRSFAAQGAEYAEKAKKLLMKYKVKHVDDLPQESFAQILKALK